MTRGKRLTPDEIHELRRLRKKGLKIDEIEEETGISHTKIVEHTKDIKSVFWSSKNATSPATNTEAPTISQGVSPQNRDNMTPPSETGYYIGPSQEQYPSQRIPVNSPSMNYGQKQYPWESQEQQRKQKEQRGYPVTFPENRVNMAPSSDSYVSSQEGYYIGPKQDQYRSSRMPINPPETDSKQDQYLQKIQEEKEREREQQRQCEEAEKKRKHEEWERQLKQEAEQRAKQRQQEEEAIERLLKGQIEHELERGKKLEEKLKEARSWREKPSQTPVQQKTAQSFAITPTPPTETENSTTAVKEIPVKEKPTQTTENKTPLIIKPSITSQDSKPQDFGNAKADDTPFSSLESPPEEMIPAETTHSNDSESRWNANEIDDGLSDAIFLGTLHGISDFLKKFSPTSINKKTNETKKNTEIQMILPIFETVPSDNNKTLNKDGTQKEKKQNDDKST